MIKRLPVILLAISILLYIISLTQVAFCTDRCRDAFEVVLLGWLAALFGGAALTWIANPILWGSWLIFKKQPKDSLIASIVAFIISLSFLGCDRIIEDEAGHKNPILSYQLGYWFWLASFGAMAIANILRHYINTNLKITSANKT